MVAIRALWAVLSLLTLAGCATGRFTVDDGRRVDETLLANIRAYGHGERLLRPAIERSARLQDKDCDKQWELPFAVATSQGWSADDRVAWARALQVDERVTVVAASASSPLAPGDKIARIERFRDDRADLMLDRLGQARDRGEPFSVTLADGRQATVRPFQVCRGYARLAPPNRPEAQDYHWLMVLHPLQIARADLDEDEALWIVLWGQGLSEEGGMRMKAYRFVTSVAGTLYNVATLATGLRGAASAANAALAAARKAAASAATELLRQQIIDQSRTLALKIVRDGLTDAAVQLARQQAIGALQAVALNRTSLTGVAWVASTVFDRADRWAFERIGRLGGSQLAGLSLHQKLIDNGFTANAIAFDPARLESVFRLAEAAGLGGQALAVLRGLNPDGLQLALAGMPLASAPEAFSFDSPHDPGHRPDAPGLIGALLDMPIESAATR